MESLYNPSRHPNTILTIINNNEDNALIMAEFTRFV